MKKKPSNNKVVVFVLSNKVLYMYLDFLIIKILWINSEVRLFLFHQLQAMFQTRIIKSDILIHNKLCFNPYYRPGVSGDCAEGARGSQGCCSIRAHNHRVIHTRLRRWTCVPRHTCTFLWEYSFRVYKFLPNMAIYVQLSPKTSCQAGRFLPVNENQCCIMYIFSLYICHIL